MSYRNNVNEMRVSGSDVYLSRFRSELERHAKTKGEGLQAHAINAITCALSEQVLMELATEIENGILRYQGAVEIEKKPPE